ncbi:outer membrane lipoprotein chaperone LolA [Campylobacter sp. RM10532]|uniref:LolA-like outer membrane lipoprotein chaperone n=1 Tax=Campylobacter TaxID=194 RepID=UPI001D7320A0|nr:outer membrane lipoprotein chaperone LolA [Campylobacter sp. RM10542]MBZ7931257.1 outer membrane lipoprotein chaperone LolA [Campylobacter sp. RM12910]MBZ7933661.1 outer membrane lipoprotein chaperone LolA [Campylobacter sp. W0065]MBZ7944555.1 outer membrane lipoprotein chaperone LolA [Campylobacter sp. RM10532]MBZ7946433.1 outer membrane lipoprotein chaperone LolA [Campylobacter sp. RM10536]MBZ7951831.1 outer membrane lipoprotein chaperone LolA [Campylobacter sp. RM9939]MBZ7956242.1 outer
MKKIFIFFLITMVKIWAIELDFNTYSSNFTQLVKSKNSTLRYSGYFIISKDKAFWEYTTPNKKEIYIDKNRVVIIEHDLEQAIFSKLENIPNLKQIFKNAKPISENKLLAKYEKVNYTIILDQDKIQSISYKDEFENDVTITLSNQIKNPKINPKIFEFKIPKNYDIVQ